MITPTVGRVVIYRPSQTEIFPGGNGGDQGLAATIAHVWHDRLVSLTVSDQSGYTYGRTSVTLHQDGPTPVGVAYCEWMEYQRGQAAKYDNLVAAGQAPKPREGA